jgi:hypothetical protein
VPTHKAPKFTGKSLSALVGAVTLRSWWHPGTLAELEILT